MSISSKRTVITLACVTALSALTAAPSLAGVITPTDKTTVSTASPVDSVYYGWGGYPYAGWGYPGVVGAAAGAGLLGLGLGIL